ncbi:YbaL family putative K(+) efflux transporter [Azospirillum sp.]|uniref:YbaL family putative K(+) efflux transporter n=1 Tax=Azospirillum sp. TaxID=34012 RepID=UPI002D31D585|nr:YbaL family putative K(+) efflux transporter [Azospirillum sp.]HYD68041.1 YbaL family putative K(+) efflux transporter [Azospirillum sp.]
MHHGPLIAMLVAGFGLAFAFGALAHRLRVSPLVGYLMAGIAVGPFTPGFVADQGLANELAEIGVILLMFGVGLHFSLKDLLSVRAVAVPGAVVQIAAATAMGAGLATWLGWSLLSGIIFGLALSVASTVVLLRALQEQRLVQTERGRIAVGWLIVEDLAMVLALVLIPAVAGAAHGGVDADGPLGMGVAGIILLTLGKVSAFVAFMLIVGRRVIPWILHWVAHTGSRELFRLAVLAIALTVAFGAAMLFGVSFALGAFFAGMILSESELSQRAAAETLPLRDAFAVLFFVSVGMLFNPAIIVQAPWELAATLAIILIGKSAAAFLIVRAFGRPTGTALTISASLAQIGEFSFILAGLGVGLGILPAVGRDLILAGAILSIVVNPLLFGLIARLVPREEPAKPEPATSPATTAPAAPAEPAHDLQPTALTGHTVLIGYGRVGALVGAGLREARVPFVVVEDRTEPAEAARGDGAELLFGNAADPDVLAATNLAGARHLIVAIPEAFEAGQVVEQARAANPNLEIVARAHSDAELDHLATCGASHTVMGEREIARCMLSLVLDDWDTRTDGRRTDDRRAAGAAE